MIAMATARASAVRSYSAWNRYGHLVPGGENQARECLDAFLAPRPSNPGLWRTTPRTTNPRHHGGSEVPLPGIRSQPLRSDVGRFYLEICWFLARLEPLLRGSKPPSIGIGCGATVARVLVIAAAPFQQRSRAKPVVFSACASVWQGHPTVPALVAGRCAPPRLSVKPIAGGTGTCVGELRASCRSRHSALPSCWRGYGGAG